MDNTLRTLLVSWPLMVVLAAALAVDAPALRAIPIAPEPPEPTWNEQIAAVRAGQHDTLRIQEQIINDANLADLIALDRLIVLELDQSEVTATGLKHLQTLPNFRRLTLRGRPLDDAALAAICQTPTLRYLNLPQTVVTDAGLAAILARPELVQLRLSSPHITDAGMATIAKLKKLRALHLIDTPITDAGLAKLAGMTQLESLYLDGTPVTDEGIEKLLNQLPELHFHIDQQHSDRDPKKNTHGH